MSILPVTQKNIVIMQMIGAIIRPFAVPMRLLPHVSVPTAENTHSRSRCVTNRSWQIETHTNTLALTHTLTHILQMFTETQDILAVSLRKGSGIRRYMESTPEHPRAPQSTLWSQNTGVSECPAGGQTLLGAHTLGT